MWFCGILEAIGTFQVFFDVIKIRINLKKQDDPR